MGNRRMSKANCLVTAPRVSSGTWRSPRNWFTMGCSSALQAGLVWAARSENPAMNTMAAEPASRADAAVLRINTAYTIASICLPVSYLEEPLPVKRSVQKVQEGRYGTEAFLQLRQQLGSCDHRRIERGEQQILLKAQQVRRGVVGGEAFGQARKLLA